MSDEVKNDYYKITAMTEAFRRYDDSAKNVKPGLTFQEEQKQWELRFLLAIAQQLSVVSSHLGKIVKKSGGE
jgi:hypothetical protein